ncbi:condensation domain-containing protein, partial [Maribacter sp. 2-571]|uniref:condensation domain-containing protein n=1 Tax=Maribacter sp. 2-571 TaxID=3417569 RepID=UPI003D34D53F
MQYADYAIWQRTHLEGDVLEGQLSYWEERLSGAANLGLPTDHVRPSVQSTEGASIQLELDGDLRDALVSLGREEGTTLFMTLLSAFKVLMYRYSGQEDVSIGTPIANRTQEELEGMIGFFVNTLVLRSDLGGDPGFRELLQQVKGTTLGAYDHQSAPFEKVVDRVVKTRDMSMPPLFQVLFALQNTPEEDGGATADTVLEASPYEDEDTTSKFDLSLSAFEDASGISLELEYCTDLFNADTIARMLSHYRELLRSIVADPASRITDLSMLTFPEERQLL